MQYYEDYRLLKNIFDINKNIIDIPNSSIEILNLSFESQCDLIYPDNNHVDTSKFDNSKDLHQTMTEDEIEQIVQISDTKIKENRLFKFILFKPKSERKIKDVVVLIHGINEQDWTKYLSWAKKIVELTNKAVLLFPIAFHMNRGLKIWGNSRLMAIVSKQRAKLFPSLRESSFINVASSIRLHYNPARFFLSGLETYNDIIKLIYKIKEDRIGPIDKNANIDFFGYSAGAFLAEIILMANRDKLFDQSKAFLFCGGASLEGMHLTSKYIIDNIAENTLHEFYLKDFQKKLAKESTLSNLFENAKEGGEFFFSMLSEHYALENQKKFKRLQNIGKRIRGINLTKDKIIPPENVKKTLKHKDYPNEILLQEIDFEHKYNHMMPFSYQEKIADKVTNSFNAVFENVADFLG